MPPFPPERATSLLLWIGLAAGLGTALAGVLRLGASGAGPRPESIGAAAVVDGVPIPAERYLQSLASLADEERAPRLDAGQRRRILEEMIAEELLIRRALELDLARKAPIARRRLLAVMVDMASRGDGDERPEEADLRGLYAENPGRFAAGRRLRVASVFVRGGSPSPPAGIREARARLLRGEDPKEVGAALGDPGAVSPPDALLPRRTLANYVGPSAARAAARLHPGGVTEPVRVAGGWRVLLVVDRTDPAPPAFEKVRQAVRDLWEQRRRARRLEVYLRDLREDAEIAVDERLLDPATPIPTTLRPAAKPASPDAP